MMVIDNEVVTFLSFNAHFRYSPVGFNRESCNMYQKEALLNYEKSLVYPMIAISGINDMNDRLFIL